MDKWVKKGAFSLLALLVSLFILLGVITSLIVGTESGLRFLLWTVPRLAHTRVEIGTVHGTLYRGFTLKEITVESDSYYLSTPKISWQWASKNNNSAYNLEVKLIDLGKVDFQEKKQEKRRRVLEPPYSLRLPFTFKIDRLHLSSLQIDKTVVVKESNLSLSYQKGRYHLVIPHLLTYDAEIKANFLLSASKPFALSGLIHIYKEGDLSHHFGKIALTGSLIHPQLAVDIKGNDLFLLGTILFSPFDPLTTRRIVKADMVGHDIHLHRLWPSLPITNLSFNLQIKDEAQGLVGHLNLTNGEANYYENNGIPLKDWAVTFRVQEDGTLWIQKSVLQLIKGGYLIFQGRMEPDGELNATAQVKLGLINLMNTPIINNYEGGARLLGTLKKPALVVNLHSPMNELKVQVVFLRQKKILHFRCFEVMHQGHYFSGQGNIFLLAPLRLDFDLQGKDFDPHSLNPSYPHGSLNGTLALQGNLDDGVNAKVNLSKSYLQNHELNAQGFINISKEGINDSDLNLILGSNHLYLKGGMGKKPGQLTINLNMPHLDYLGMGVTGQALLKGIIKGTFREPSAHLTGYFHEVKIKDYLKIAFLNFFVELSQNRFDPFKVLIEGGGIKTPGAGIEKIHSLFTGTLANHGGNIGFTLKLPGQSAFKGQYAAHGGLNDKQEWLGSLDALNLQGAVNILLQHPVKLIASSQRLYLGPASWKALGGDISIDHFSWQKGAGLKTKGSARHIDLRALHPFLHFPFKHNLVVKGDWDFIYSKAGQGHIDFKKESGDLQFSDRQIPLGLDEFSLTALFKNNKIYSRLDTRTRFADGRVDLSLIPAWGERKSFLKSALTGKIALNAPDISNFKYLLPVGIELNGALTGEADITGTVIEPRLNGYLSGKNLSYRDLGKAIYLSNGTLQSRLKGEQWLIDRLQFKNKNGEIMAHGFAGKIGGAYGAALDIALDHYWVMNQPRRQFEISGQARLGFAQETGLRLTGDLRLDRGYYENLSASRPNLSSDVQVIGAEKKHNDDPIPLYVHLNLDLNDKMRFILSDLDFLLGGKLRLLAKDHSPLKVYGQIYAKEGNYRAYGQNLYVEHGTMDFNGSWENAWLNVRARRYQSPVGAGVDVTGSLKEPKVAMIANAPMTDREKLSWLVLGREAKGMQDQDALALALGVVTAERVNKKAGSLLDNIGLSSRESRNLETGEMNPAEQMITLGKQINQHLYLSYEFGIQSSEQAVRLIYQFSQALSAFARMGHHSGGGGVKYKIRFD